MPLLRQWPYQYTKQKLKKADRYVSRAIANSVEIINNKYMFKTKKKACAFELQNVQLNQYSCFPFFANYL